MKIISLISISLLFMGSNKSNAQGCCTQGTICQTGLESGIINYKSLFVGINYEYNKVNKAYNSTTATEDPLKREANIQNINFSIEYGLTKKISILMIPSVLVIRHRESTARDSNNLPVVSTFTSAGFGDITVLGKYNLFNFSRISSFGVDIGFGVKLPTGSYTRDDNGVKLPIDMQPGNGAIELIGSLYIRKSFSKINLNLLGNVSYRYIGANFDGYKIGDELFISLTSNQAIANILTVSGTVRARVARKDYSQGRFLSSTGSFTLFAIPRIAYYVGNLNLNVYYQVPVYRDVNGTQLTVSQVLGAEAKYTFNF